MYITHCYIQNNLYDTNMLYTIIHMTHCFIQKHAHDNCFVHNYTYGALFVYKNTYDTELYIRLIVIYSTWYIYINKLLCDIVISIMYSLC